MKLHALLLGICLASGSFAQNGSVVLSVNGENVEQNEYYRKMEFLPGLGRTFRGTEFVEILPGIATIDALITEKLLIQVAKGKGLLPTESEIDADIKFRLGRDPNVMKYWKSVGRTDAEYRRLVLLELCQFKLQTEGIKVDDAAIKDLYDLSKSTRYTLPQRYILRAITVDKEDQKKTVDADLKAGKSFASVATLNSIDESSSEGGLFGEVPLTLLSQNLREALIKVKKGGKTSWITNDKGQWTMFYVEDILAETVRPLDATLKEELKREIMLRKGSSKNNVGALVKEARLKAQIKITSPEFNEAYQRFINGEKKPG
jgi:parvulin-like peptidyl-prolyl isomerase